eukprot:scaffold7232_cov63-Cyclotella_meneghiniana.AAC.3
MWATIKSDFKEFATEFAEETKAVVTTNTKSASAVSDDTAGINSSDAGSNNNSNRSWASGALNLTANLSNLTTKASHVALNIDVKGFGSMIGGVVAPYLKYYFFTAASMQVSQEVTITLPLLINMRTH